MAEKADRSSVKEIKRSRAELSVDEGEQQTSTFSEELEWCISQLQVGLLVPSSSKRQKQENERHIRLLDSSKTPLPKKRQLMKTLFGDYRTKMKHHPLQANTKASIDSANKKQVSSNGMFYKVKHMTTRSTSPSNGFCFNFDD